MGKNGIKREKYRGKREKKERIIEVYRKAKETLLTPQHPKKVIGIDPGNRGALVLTDGVEFIEVQPMPITREGKEERISRTDVLLTFATFVNRYGGDLHVFLERPVSFGMGTKGAFTYGRGYEAVLIAIADAGLPFTLVEPGKWTKEMHAGLSKKWKPKAKSQVAVGRLFPRLVEHLPVGRNRVPLDGPVDALLIAGYGLRQLGAVERDFY